MRGFTRLAASHARHSKRKTSAYHHYKHPRLQLLTIQNLFDGKKIDMPPVANLTFKKAPKAKPKKRKGKTLAFDGDLEY